MLWPLLGVAAALGGGWLVLGRKYKSYVGPQDPNAVEPSLTKANAPASPPLKTGNAVLEALGYSASPNQPFNSNFDASRPVGEDNAPYDPLFVPFEGPQYDQSSYGTPVTTSTAVDNLMQHLFGDDQD